MGKLLNRMEAIILYGTYPNIDLRLTGLHLKQMMDTSGYSVKQVQEYLHLACPQPIYRWIQGKILPSVNHLYALSLLFHTHMDDILVPKMQFSIMHMIGKNDEMHVKRRAFYYQRVKNIL